MSQVGMGLKLIVWTYMDLSQGGGELGIGSLASHLSLRYGTDLDLSDASFQQNLEYIKEQIKKDIRKELKIKEGAENMRKVTTDKKSLANINNMVKQANIRLHELQQELNDLNAHIVVNTDEIVAASGKALRSFHLLVLPGFGGHVPGLGLGAPLKDSHRL